jgi:hypothetical protein
MLLFVDEIHRIVPPNETLEDSDDLKRLMEHCHGAVKRCAPQHYVEISPELAILFGKALDNPKFTELAKTNGLTIVIDNGKESVKGWEFLHAEKIGNHVHNELMKRCMLRDYAGGSNWQLVPRGVGSLVLSMVANHIAQDKGFDAITDQPLGFVLNSLNECTGRDALNLEGIVASAVATVHVPRAISHISAKEYAELRESYSDARSEFASLTRELKESARLDRIHDPRDFRCRIDDITSSVGDEMAKFRRTQCANKFNDWIPFMMTTIFPVAVGFAFGAVPGLVTAGFSLAVNSAAKLTKKSTQFRHPKVLQTLCSLDDRSWQMEMKRFR